jgi:peptidoglycan/xylan/chitin deacetylase (PgdA/CDA1 family)
MTKKVTLSFDDGPTPDVTHQVLDVLASHDVKSSFFAICSKLANAGAREAAERAVAEGHWYGSHSFAHTTPMGWMENQDDAINEIDLSFDALGTLATPRRIYRPFGKGGVLDTRLLNPVAVRHLLAQGYDCVIWDYTPREWENVDTWVDNCLEYCEDHDWSCFSLRDCEATIGARLDSLVRALEDRDVEIVQEFPPHSILMRGGVLLRDVAAFTAQAHGTT